MLTVSGPVTRQRVYILAYYFILKHNVTCVSIVELFVLGHSELLASYHWLWQKRGDSFPVPAARTDLDRPAA